MQKSTACFPSSNKEQEEFTSPFTRKKRSQFSLYNTNKIQPVFRSTWRIQMQTQLYIYSQTDHVASYVSSSSYENQLIALKTASLLWYSHKLSDFMVFSSIWNSLTFSLSCVFICKYICACMYSITLNYFCKASLAVKVSLWGWKNNFSYKFIVTFEVLSLGKSEDAEADFSLL